MGDIMEDSWFLSSSVAYDVPPAIQIINELPRTSSHRGRAAPWQILHHMKNIDNKPSLSPSSELLCFTKKKKNQTIKNDIQ
jgi:hypothetical protein